MTCSFCDILAGARDAAFVLEDDVAVAFLDNRPLFAGHCLLVPRRHVHTLAELPDALLAPFFSDVQRLERAVEKAMDAEGSFVAVNNHVSQSVPHLHVHVVPRRRGDGLKGFFWPRHPYPDPEAAAAVQRRIRTALEEASS